MARIGQAGALLIGGGVGEPQPGRVALLAVCVACLALAPAVYLWDFTVDDALISVRYAQHVAAGIGWRFNVGGPATDGVTPLPWPVILAPFARTSDALAVLFRAKCISFAAWAAVACVMAAVVARRAAPVWTKLVVGLALAVCVPVAAHAASGMETGLAMALATGAALLHARPCAAAACAGLAVSLRPELLPWALVLAAGYGRARGGAVGAVRAAAIAFAPFVVCVVVRVIAFGRPAPLALLAKPSDLSHGLVYCGAALAVAVTPVLALAPLAARRAGGAAPVLLLAAFAHALAVIAVGGDWMPYARLMAPIAPSLAYAFVLIAPHERALLSCLRALAALALGAYVFVVAAPAGRHVGRDRAALVRDARPYLAGARAVAAVDVGWVGAATNATVVDCAGVTDPVIAALPGGHTSKRVDFAMLLDRGVDRVVLLAEPAAASTTSTIPEPGRYARVVEARLASDPLFADKMRVAGVVDMRSGPFAYFIFEKR
jgi:hypothetical protein